MAATPPAPMHRFSPIQRDALLLAGSLTLLLAGVWFAVSYGVSFGPEPGIALWAVALLAAVVLVFAGSAVWWYYVYSDERDPARGEFTMDAGHHVHPGEGSYRTRPMHEGAMEEPEARLTTEPEFVPRTLGRWMMWVGGIAVALLLAAGLVITSRGSEDPVPALMAATGLIGAAIMLGAAAVGEMGHYGPWWRRGAQR